MRDEGEGRRWGYDRDSIMSVGALCRRVYTVYQPCIRIYGVEYWRFIRKYYRHVDYDPHTSPPSYLPEKQHISLIGSVPSYEILQ